MNREQQAPLHYQVRRYLLEQIRSGTLQPGDQLPTESELIDQFSVSRTTARRALNDLAGQGLVTRQAGRGSFVSELQIEQELRKLTGFVEDMEALGLHASSKLITSQPVPANEETARGLQIDLGQRVFHIARIRIANGQPVTFDDSYLVADVGELVAGEDLEVDPFYSILEVKLDIPLGTADYVLEAKAAPPSVAAHLAVPAGAPVLRIIRTTYGRDSRPLIYEYLYYRGDRVRYRLTLDRESTSQRLDPSAQKSMPGSAPE